MVEQTITPVKKTNGTLRRWEPFDVFENTPAGPGAVLASAFFVYERSAARVLPAAVNGWHDLCTAHGLCEQDGALVLKAELPGLKKEDVQVEIYNGTLVIKGESKAETEVKGEAYYCTERTFGSFYRSLPLPWDVTPEQIKATLTDWVLEVQIPKPVATTPDAIKVPVG